MDTRPAVQPHRGLNRGQPSPGTGVVVRRQGSVSEEASSVGGTVGSRPTCPAGSEHGLMGLLNVWLGCYHSSPFSLADVPQSLQLSSSVRVAREVERMCCLCAPG